MRQHTLQWLFLILLLAPPLLMTLISPAAALHAQTSTSSPAPTAEPVEASTSQANTVRANRVQANTVQADNEPVVDDAVIQETIDALIDQQVEALIAEMDTADKVGQLFVVHFEGEITDFDSPIAELIHGYRIGGVVISPAYRNFTNERVAETPADVARLANQLQALAYGHLLPVDEALLDGDIMDMVLLNGTAAGEEAATFVEQLPTFGDTAVVAGHPSQNVPLFIGIEQLGDDLTVTSLRRQFSEVPNQMTLGATWNPALARTIGEVVGKELSTVGVNLLLGPSLDVNSQPRPDSVGHLSIHMYGGNPYWTSELGKAYIAGIHSGSDGELLTTARHFPGQGDVDRLPDQELATIQDSIEDLRLKGLAPFKAVTEMGPAEAARTGVGSITDLMMSSHMRYAGVQPTGAGRVPPISLAPEFAGLVVDEGFEPWLESGLIMSGPLGVPALRRFYQSVEGEFPIRQVAKEAVIAGNDLLYMGNGIGGSDSVVTWEEEFENIKSTVFFFLTQYESDLDFADRVDEALRRVLRTKLRLYADQEALAGQARAIATETALSVTQTVTDDVGTIATPVAVMTAAPSDALAVTLEQLLVARDDLAIFTVDSEHLSDSNALTRQIARESLTVLYPDITEPSEALPPPPNAGDEIVIFTDSRLEQECSDCRAEVSIGPEDVEKIILRLYGPKATDQITAGQLTSLTFVELDEVLDSSAEQTSEATDLAVEVDALPLPTPTLDAPSVEEEIAASSTLTDTVDGEADVPIERTAQIEQQIEAAAWLIFVMLDVDAEAHPSSDVVKRFLSERTEQIEDKETVVLALHAPYFLDATEISGLSSYLGVYGRATPFLENAVRAIFRNHVPTGAPPVSVPGTRFADLATQLQPDPALTIAMRLLDSEDQPLMAEAENGVESSPSVLAGDTIRVQIGPVLDRNGHSVPDGIPVEFQVIYDGVEMALNVESANTRNGIALRDILLERGGMARISASSLEATTGDPITLMVDEKVAPVEPLPDDTPQAPGTDAPADGAASPEPAGVDTGRPSVLGEWFQLNLPTADERVNMATFVVAMIMLLGMLSLLLIVQIRVVPRPTLVHNMLWTVIVGLAGYVMYGVGLLPGASMLHGYFELLAAPLVVFVGMSGTMLWLLLRTN